MDLGERDMSRRTFFGIMFILLLTSTITLELSVPSASAIISKKTYIFMVTWSDQTFYVVIETTSDISGFYFSQPTAEIGFNVTGTDGAYGFSNVTIPKSLLWTDNAWEWQVLMDNNPLGSVIFFNGTHTKFFLQYMQSTHKIQIIGTHTVGPLPERKVGVKVGDWAKYELEFDYATNDPDPYIPPPPYDSADIAYSKLEVLAITGTVISFNSTVRFVNGTEMWNVFDCDVSTGNGVTYYFIGANLSAGDRIYLNPYSPKINSTMTKTYAGAEREVNYVYLKMNMTFSPDLRYVGELHIYWDRTAGIIVETIQIIEYIDLAEGYVTKIFGHMILTETNIWQSEKTLLGRGFGWFKIGPHRHIFGKVELYKVGDNQIELVLIRPEKEYTRTWKIIRHVKTRGHEYYLCYSQEYGVLTVHLQYTRRDFWLAIGKSAIAGGPL